MTLDQRSRKILQLVVEAYVTDAQPVSSKAVLRRGKGLNMSSATIRSVMAELEMAGMLHQPHTSAGRVPTDLGIRTYVDDLVSPKLHPWDRTHLDAAAAESDTAGFPASLGQRLAGLSGHVAVVALPKFLGSQFREMGLVRCAAGRFLAYFVSPNGLIQQKLVEMQFDLGPDELQAVQNFLNDRLVNRSLSEMREIIRAELAEAMTRCDTLRAHALELGDRALPEPVVEIHIEGASHLAGQPEFADQGKLRHLLRAIEERQVVLQLLDRLLEGCGVRVLLGSEHEVRGATDLACVGGVCVGLTGAEPAVTLLGPPRMDYGRLVPMVDYATQLLGRYWAAI